MLHQSLNHVQLSQQTILVLHCHLLAAAQTRHTGTGQTRHVHEVDMRLIPLKEKHIISQAILYTVMGLLPKK